LGLGLVAGLILGGAFGAGVTRPMFAERVRPFLSRFTSARPTLLNFALIGLAAALGEETLFRVALQPSLGIVIAALLFTLAHTAIADFSHPTPGKLAYAGLAFAMGIVLGLEYEHLGIAASMGTHFAFDTTALLLVRPLLPSRPPV
jgi:membrane protease YdiL (CAAX protease family)